MLAFVKGEKVADTIQLHFLQTVSNPSNRPCMLIFGLFLLLKESVSDIFWCVAAVRIGLEMVRSSLQKQLCRIHRYRDGDSD